MFDLGWTELLLVGIVALIVVGPKDLPGMFRTLGRFTAKAKSMAREFQRAMDDAADEAGMKEAAKDLKSMTNPKKMGLDALNDAVDKFEKWTPPTPGDADAADDGPAEMTEERAEAARKIKEATANMARSRQAAEAALAKGSDLTPPEADSPAADGATDGAQDTPGKTDA